ncbi:MAG TPA: NADPH-dependent assimilatory sulfite reductase hemoprotein subunit, partial [Flavisolibacter sp.]|nr:NADPH-dependent assimilatory sulfite reductase hemoprotein subunit [Flavisolibacter sp.]
TRQTLQLHGLLKGKVKPTIHAFNQAKLDSIATCGDINRNVACSSNPFESPVHEQVFAYADKISTLLMPKTKAYYEIWLDEEKILDKKDEEDPLYQDRYMPRKFKIGIAIPPNNDVDVLTNDIGLIAIIENNNLVGFNIAIGGGLSSTHGNPEHYPRLATVIGFVDSEEKALKAVFEILTVQRDYGNRSDRKKARLKYTVDEKGIPFFKAEVEKRTGFLFEEPRPYAFHQRSDNYGWKQDTKGAWHYTVFVENGRVVDEKISLRSALLEVAQAHKSVFRFTSNQNVIVSDVSEEDKALIHAILEKYGVIQHTDGASAIRKNAMACVAFNTCPLALAEAQRYMPSLITKIEPLLQKHGLIDEEITIRMTGCPNGCARSANAEIGFIGTAYGRYNMHLGGDRLGMRLNKLYKEQANEETILTDLDSLFGLYASDRVNKESFGDFIIRKQLV